MVSCPRSILGLIKSRPFQKVLGINAIEPKSIAPWLFSIHKIRSRGDCDDGPGISSLPELIPMLRFYLLIPGPEGKLADALGELCYTASDYFQICHQRLVLRKLGLIAYNNKSIPTTSKTTLRTLMLCVFTIMASGPNCNHISQPPTIANIALTIKLIEIILLLPLTCFNIG